MAKGQRKQVIESFDHLKPEDKVWLICRVSGRERKRNLKDQDANLRQAAGSQVVGTSLIQTSGFDPGWLSQEVTKALQAGATVLLAETTDRFIREPGYDSISHPNIQASEDQLDRLARCAGGMRLMTHLDSHASPSEVRSYQRKRGQRYKSKGGRPKKRSKEQRQKLARWLYGRGWVIRDIAEKRMVGASKSTVGRWVNG